MVESESQDYLGCDTFERTFAIVICWKKVVNGFGSIWIACLIVLFEEISNTSHQKKKKLAIPIMLFGSFVELS
jgi:hypothetical protein